MSMSAAVSSVSPRNFNFIDCISRGRSAHAASSSYLNSMAHVSDFSLNSNTTPYNTYNNYYDYNNSTPQNIDYTTNSNRATNTNSTTIQSEEKQNIQGMSSDNKYHSNSLNIDQDESTLPSTTHLPALESATFQESYNNAVQIKNNENERSSSSGSIGSNSSISNRSNNISLSANNTIGANFNNQHQRSTLIDATPTSGLGYNNQPQVVENIPHDFASVSTIVAAAAGTSIISSSQATPTSHIQSNVLQTSPFDNKSTIGSQEEHQDNQHLHHQLQPTITTSNNSNNSINNNSTMGPESHPDISQIHHQHHHQQQLQQQGPVYTELQNYQGPYYPSPSHPSASSHPHPYPYENPPPSTSSLPYPPGHPSNHTTDFPPPNKPFGDSQSPTNSTTTILKQHDSASTANPNNTRYPHNTSPYASNISPCQSNNNNNYNGNSNYTPVWPPHHHHHQAQIGSAESSASAGSNHSVIAQGGVVVGGAGALPPPPQSLWHHHNQHQQHHQYNPQGSSGMTPPTGTISPSGFTPGGAGLILPHGGTPDMMGVGVGVLAPPGIGVSMGDMMPSRSGKFFTHPSISPWTVRGKMNAFVSLYNGEMWARFHERINEMIITKHGRRMFPVLHFLLSGLDPNKYYHVWVDMVLADNSHWKFQGGKWVSGGSAEPMSAEGREYHHPDSPNTGTHWMKQEVSFGKLKLTNNKNCKQKQVILNSMHRYQPRFHIAEDVNGKEGELLISHAFEDTQFIAVTAYQNMDITQLKIDNNPFAKGFRDNFESRLRMSDLQNQEPFPVMSPHSALAPHMTVGHPSWGPSPQQGAGAGFPPAHSAFVNMYQPHTQTPMASQGLYQGNPPGGIAFQEDKRQGELGPNATQHFLDIQGQPYNTDPPEEQLTYPQPSALERSQVPTSSSYYHPYCQENSLPSVSTFGSNNTNSSAMMMEKHNIDSSDYFRRPDLSGAKVSDYVNNPSHDWKSANVEPESQSTTANNVFPMSKNTSKHGGMKTQYGSEGYTEMSKTPPNIDLFQNRSSPENMNSPSTFGSSPNNSSDLAQSTTPNLNSLLSLCKKSDSSPTYHSSGGLSSTFNRTRSSSTATLISKSNPGGDVPKNKLKHNHSNPSMNVNCFDSRVSPPTAGHTVSATTPENFLDDQGTAASYNLNFMSSSGQNPAHHDKMSLYSSVKSSLTPSQQQQSLEDECNFYQSTNSTISQPFPSVYHTPPKISSLTSTHSDPSHHTSSSGMTSLTFPTREDEEGAVMDFSQMQRQAAELSLDFMSKDVSLPSTHTSNSASTRDSKSFTTTKDISTSSNTLMTHAVTESNNATAFFHQQGNKQSSSTKTDKQNHRIPHNSNEAYRNTDKKKPKSTKKNAANSIHKNNSTEDRPSNGSKRRSEECNDKSLSKKLRTGDKAQ